MLEDLDAKVKEYKSLDTHPSGLGPKTGKFWKKLKWDQNEADALRLRLISSTTGLEVFYSGVARYSSMSHLVPFTVILDQFTSVSSLHDSISLIASTVSALGPGGSHEVPAQGC